MQKQSVIIRHGADTFMLVRFQMVDSAWWNVYSCTGPVQLRGKKLFGFIDMDYTDQQAEHTATQCLHSYARGVIRGSADANQRFRKLVDQLDH